MPGISSFELESRSPFSQGRYAWIEYKCTRRNLPLGGERSEPFPIDRFDLISRVSEENESATDQARAQSRPESFERPEQSVDRATRGSSCGLVYRHCQKPPVFPASSHCQ